MLQGRPARLRLPASTLRETVMKRMLLGAGTAVSLVIVAACRQAEAPAPTAEEGNAVAANVAESIKARQTHYKQIGAAMKGIGDQLKAGSPDIEVLRQHAATMQTFAPQISGWFPEGTGSEAGLRTRAKAEIWSDPEGFRRASEQFVGAANGFHQAAATGDLAAIRAAAGPLGTSCRDCHDRFRAPEE
jgi:cytochrome c556